MGEYRTALVTGASRGIGRAIALRLRSEGMKVLALGRDAAALEALAAEHGVVPVEIDVRDRKALSGLVAEAEIDVLVNNAGVLSSRSVFQEIAPDDIDSMIDVNVKAPLHLSRLVLPGMIARGRGHLFFIGSSAGRFPHPNVAVYGASKAGISLFCDALRLDLLGTGIRITEIAPGRVETDIYRTALGVERARSELYEGFLTIQPNDIAELLVAALRLPDQVDVSRLEVFPTSQAAGGSMIVKRNTRGGP